MPGVYRPAAAATLTLYLDDCMGSLPPEALRALQGEPSTAPWIPGGSEWAARGGGGDPSVLIANVVPKSTTVRRNPFREADEASVSIRYADLPLDVRLVRQMGIALRMGCIPHDKFGEAMARGRSPVLDAMFASDGNLRYVGFMDTHGESFNDDGEWTSLEFRDVVKVLNGKQVPPEAWGDIPWGRPVEEILLGALETCDAVSGLVLDLVDVEPGKVYLESGIIQTAGKAKKAPVRGPTVERSTYWDLLAEITYGMGLLFYSDVRQGPATKDASGQAVTLPPHRFVLTRPSAVYDTRRTLPVWHLKAKRNAAGKLAFDVTGPDDAPQFAAKGRPDPRDPTGRNVLAVPTVIYGHNLQELHFERRHGQVEVPSIQLRCQAGKYVLVATAQGRPTVGHMARSAYDRPMVYTVTGYTSQAALQAAAEQMVDEIGRGDVTMTFTTKDMATFGGDNADPDVLDLRAGSPLCVLFAKQLADGTVSDRLAIEAMSESELRDRLKRRAGMEDQPAKELARYLKDARYSQRAMTTWFLRSGEMGIDEEGFRASGEACNYFWQPEGA